MSYTFRYYRESDDAQVRKLVLASYQWSAPAWSISRHEFCHGLHPAYVGAPGSWRHTNGLWFEGEHLAAAVVSEGNYDGGAFLLFDRVSRMNDRELLDRMLFHAETHIARFESTTGERILDLHVPVQCPVLRDYARERGYEFKGIHDRQNILTFPEGPFEIELPAGFRIIDGTTAPAFYLSNVHAFSFQYGLPHTETGEAAFNHLRQMPDYRPELELVALDPEGKPAGMAIIWYHEAMPYCELEPLGVVWWHRRKGVAKALLWEAANRVRKIGPARGMLGGDQPFYETLGFVPEGQDEFWQCRRKVR